jgi:prephenate dehydrogenase
VIIEKYFNRIIIIGVGLLGASIGLALKERSFKGVITGIGRDEKKLRKAMSAGIIDNYSTSIEAEAGSADLIIICTPVGAISDIYKKIYSLLGKNTIVTDVGSTKYKILKEISAIEKGNSHFIGSHPMAGSEKSGFEFGSSGLYNESVVAVIKDNNTSNKNLKKINSFWECIGARVVNISSKEHDEIVGETSHVPHIISSLVAYSCMMDKKSRNIFNGIFGNGLIDITRLASSDPGIWIDIFASNKKNILNTIKEYKKNLDLFERLLLAEDYGRLKKVLEDVKSFRGKLARKKM